MEAHRTAFPARYMGEDNQSYTFEAIKPVNTFTAMLGIMRRERGQTDCGHAMPSKYTGDDGKEYAFDYLHEIDAVACIGALRLGSKAMPVITSVPMNEILVIRKKYLRSTL
jgi:hypothetical protein